MVRKKSRQSGRLQALSPVPSGGHRFTSFNAFAKEVVALADGFDPDYETSLWLGPDGHGANGAPYHIRDILDDMDAVQSAYNELADAFRPFVTEF